MTRVLIELLCIGRAGIALPANAGGNPATPVAFANGTGISEAFQSVVDRERAIGKYRHWRRSTIRP